MGRKPPAALMYGTDRVHVPADQLLVVQVRWRWLCVDLLRHRFRPKSWGPPLDMMPSKAAPMLRRRAACSFMVRLPSDCRLLKGIIMRSPSQVLLPSVLLGAGLMLSSVVAQAAMGYEVKPAQERLVHEGMTATQVRETLGRADRDIRYRHEPGATWTYQVSRGPGADVTLFDVKFNADGTVASTAERFEEAD
jgi:hypothetical protein